MVTWGSRWLAARGAEFLDAPVSGSSAVASPFIAYKREAFLKPGTTPVSFTTALMSKDLQLAMEVAGCPSP
ncbi:MAG: hypothetical protein LBI49_14595, partial [Nocardiopsaceae bacterium]|nr:hypothetical protein [Nocardiopsaceae bacterium]